MKFSVVVPLFNKAPYVEATLMAALSQPEPDLEVVVVDDGSTDGGADVVRKLQATHPNVRLVCQDNAGVSSARNRGIQESSGEWVAFLDADDLWHAQQLHVYSALMALTPSADAVGVGYETVVFGTDAASAACPPLEPGLEMRARVIHDFPALWQSGPCVMLSTVAVRRSRLLDLMPCFPHDEHRGEDLDFLFRLTERTSLVFLPDALVKYVHVPLRLGSQGGHTQEPPFVRRLWLRATSGDLPPTLSRSSLRFVADFRITQARYLHMAGDRSQALRCLWKSGPAWRLPRWWVSLFALAWPLGWARVLYQRRMALHKG